MRCVIIKASVLSPAGDLTERRSLVKLLLLCEVMKEGLGLIIFSYSLNPGANHLL